MQDNPIQFAVVREDPLLEARVLRRHPARRLLLIASGGCTALTLASVRPDLKITLLDPNPSQLDLVKRKIRSLANGDRLDRNRMFNVDNSDPGGLSECGNFESLFRGLRSFLAEFVLPSDEMRRLFCEPGALADVSERLFAHPYWPVAFDLFFAEPLLNTMFGPDATQYAEPDSYPAYFRGLFERGLTRGDAMDNRFLHHVLLGCYLDRPACLPEFLTDPPDRFAFGFHHGTIDEQVNLSDYDFIGLSNIMDWMAPTDVERLMGKVLAETGPGTVVMWRQLNNRRDLAAHLRPAFRFDAAWDRALWEQDRSLFYSSVHVGLRDEVESRGTERT